VYRPSGQVAKSLIHNVVFLHLKRADVLWLKSQGLAHQEICRLTGICGNTLRSYLRLFCSGGVDKVMELKFYAPTSELEQHRHRLEVHFRQHPPATIKEAMANIQELTGLKRSPMPLS